MIFRQWKQVLNGTKTQTRRLVRPGEHYWADSNRSGTEVMVVRHRNYYLRWEVGRIYAVQPGRSKKGVGRVKLLQIRREHLHDISLEDITAEGIRSWSPDGMLQRLEWRALWDSIYYKDDERWVANPLVWPLTFEIA